MCKLTTSLPKHFPTDEEKYFAYFAAKNEPVLCKAASSIYEKVILSCRI
jgi:hypothetical protein